MKIGILIDEIAPGSAPKLIGWPIRALKDIGVEAEALVIIDKPHWKQHKQHYDQHLEGIKIRYLFPRFPKFLQKINFKFPGMSFFSLHHLASWFYAHRSVVPGEYDLIIGHCQYSAFAGRNLLKHYGFPFLLLIWDPSTFTAVKIYKDRFGWKYPLLYLAAKVLDKFAVSKCSALITSGKFHHTHFKTLTKKPLETLIPGCFVLKKLPPFSSRKKVILTYDRWDIGNIPNIFLDILEKLDQKDISLTIGGFWHPSSLRGQFEEAVKSRGLEQRVRLLGPLDEKMIMDLASTSFVHVHPVHEAFGMQTLEAAGCGCPGVIPAGSGVAELFEHGVSGMHPPMGDFDAMVESINHIFNSPDLAQTMSQKAWQVAKGYTWDNYAKTLARIAEKYSGKDEFWVKDKNSRPVGLKT